MKNNPLISCVVCCFNSERYLSQALKSIFSQTYGAIEVIVADGGSSDGTAMVAAGYGKKVRYIFEKTSTPSEIRNLGLRESQGKFIAFLDADDLWHPQKLALQMACFVKRPKLEICLSYAQMFWIEDLKNEDELYRESPRMKPVPGYATTTLLARREVFKKMGGFNPKLWFADATDWFMRAFEKKIPMQMLPEVLTYHRLHESNLTRRQTDASRDEFLNVMKMALDRRRYQS